jgi:hypothetical protein
MAKKPDKREVCEKLFAHRIKQRQVLQRNQRAVDNASSTGENEKSPGLRPAAKDQLPSPENPPQGISQRNHPNPNTFTSFRRPDVLGCSARVAKNAQTRPRISRPVTAPREIWKARQ